MYEIILTKKAQQFYEKAVIFGSRAIGNFKRGSDIDIALYGKKLTSDILNNIKIKLNEQLPIPYFIDIVNYAEIQNENLKKHIDREGKVFYSREKVFNL
ncbi:MAG TPA: nucleotidyltransferase domain-containing protein [Ignavibacteria bacterium]|nr:nucleotidyltransferase domain-containing protein [Ignavibacteria bacterium]